MKKSPATAAKRRIPAETDRRLVAALEHEMQLCRAAFARFEHFGGREVMGDKSRTNTRQSHDAYAEFLRTLYGFYLGCFQRDRADLRSIESDDADQLFTALIERYLARRRNLIQRGLAPKSENDLSYYEIPAPKEFAAQFRRIRNANSHVSIHRIQSERDWSLTDFYDRCHRLVMILYQDAWTWGRSGRQTDLGNVDTFTVAKKLQPKE
jgi:hypothetical protein